MSDADAQRFLANTTPEVMSTAKKRKKQLAESELSPMAEPTWRASVPVLASFEHWQHRAQRFPYIRRSDELNETLLRGVTCQPRLSDYPMCKDVIVDYYQCRDRHPFLAMWNICAPLKEQLSACINEVFVKNHAKMGKKMNDGRDEMFERNREKRMQRLTEHAEGMQEKRQKLID